MVDPAVMESFPLDEDMNVSLVAWTTTPWTLPSNLALCVHPDLVYVRVKVHLTIEINVKGGYRGESWSRGSPLDKLLIH